MARENPNINQRSGVSVRLTVSNYETLIAGSLRRALLNEETYAVPRVSDLSSLVASTSGKIEIETLEDGRETEIIRHLIKQSVLEVFRRNRRPFIVLSLT